MQVQSLCGFSRMMFTIMLQAFGHNHRMLDRSMIKYIMDRTVDIQLEARFIRMFKGVYELVVSR